MSELGYHYKPVMGDRELGTAPSPGVGWVTPRSSAWSPRAPEFSLPRVFEVVLSLAEDELYLVQIGGVPEGSPKNTLMFNVQAQKRESFLILH